MGLIGCRSDLGGCCCERSSWHGWQVPRPDLQQEKAPGEGPWAGLAGPPRYWGGGQPGQGAPAVPLSPLLPPRPSLGGCRLCGAGLPAFSWCRVLQRDPSRRVGRWQNGVVCAPKGGHRGGFAPSPGLCPPPAFCSAAGRERGRCLSQTCKWIKGFQMQISRLRCRSLRDMDGAAPWGRAATCQGGPMPQGAQRRRLSWGPGCSWASPGVPPAPGESQ